MLTTPNDQLASDQVSGGRHRRPETLASAARDALRRRGKHVRPADRPSASPLFISVKPIAAALSGPEKPPVIGSHRAPGTLPIESWVLLGKPRQQALLGALVAVGLALVMIPVASQDSPLTTVNASDQATAALEQAKSRGGNHAKPADGAAKQEAKTPTKVTPAKNSGNKPGKSTRPNTSPSAKPTGEPEPDVKVPSGDGPNQSLRTTGSKAVALTFDDGPDPVQTPKILALLAENEVKATFCLVGEQVQKHPEIVKQIVDAGHTLCNHTWNHSLTIGKDKPSSIRADLVKTTAAIQAAVPGVPVPFFRAPGGNFSDRLVKVAYAEGMRSIYWQTDPRDWEHPEKETDKQHIARIVKDVKSQVAPGAIVLSHDFGQPDTIAAYEELLPWLSENFELGIPPELPATPPAGDAAAADK